MRYVNDESRLKGNRGQGIGKNYIPWIKTREAHSIGTCANPLNWKNGRIAELLSQGEFYFWLVLMWNDHVTDIREQFPLLPLKSTEEICDYYKIRHPMANGKERIMTTDFLVTMADGTKDAYAIKVSQKELENNRTVDKLFIERKYWESFGIGYHIVTKDRINAVLARNINCVCQYYDFKYVFDSYSCLKHLIATKQLSVDMESAPLDFGQLLHRFGKELPNYGYTT